MRLITLSTLSAAVLAATTATAAPLAKPAPVAVSAERYGLKADYRGPVLNVGYSWKARKAATCLAAYPGLYDPKTDVVHLRPGVNRKCTL